MLPFLLLATRAEDDAAAEEYATYLRFGGLTPDRLHRVRMESGPTPPLDLDRYAGVIVGGSPYNSGDPDESKTDDQRRVEAELAALLTEIVDRDLPFLGACYGVGTLGVHQGGVVDRTYGEEVGAVPISLTDEGAADPLLAGLPRTFDAYVGHKEACNVLPPNATLLASSPKCPVQMFRIKRNLYATQFHPELDLDGLISRIHIYKHAGYFRPEDASTVIARARTVDVQLPPIILRNFVSLFG